MASSGGKTITYDISQLLPEDIININLDDGHTFLNSLRELGYCCSKGGTTQNEKPVTHRDPDHPVCVARVEGMYRGVDVTTHFLILKSDVYDCAYCFEDDILSVENWFLLKENSVKLPGSQTAKFGLSYIQTTPTSKSKDNSLNHLRNSVGKGVLLSALHALKYPKPNRDSDTIAAFHSICYHLCESVRFRDVALKIASAFSSDSDSTPLGDLINWFNQYNFMSTCHRKKVVVNDPKWNLKLKDKVGIEDFERLNNALGVVLMENERERDNRRMKKLLSSKKKKALAKYKAKVSDITQKNNPPNTNNWTRQQLEENRDARLRQLIAEGGNSDVWLCLKQASCQRKLRLKKLKIEHTDVNVVKSDLSDAYDDDAYRYELGKDHDYMLSDPVGIPPAEGN